ncbi:Auxin-responsive protein [Abeliophyllum distichum]|uniref:Auxin-responsive protein n=1 Tax=Abeliophyllum distichum TaxID=126358 RepID=A0ABD1TIS5_9LAMI
MSKKFGFVSVGFFTQNRYRYRYRYIFIYTQIKNLRLGLPGSEFSNKKARNGFYCFWKDLKNETNNGFFQNPLKNIFLGAKRGFSDAIDGSNEWVCVLMVKDWWPIATGFRRRLSGLQPRVAGDIWCCMEVEVEVEVG